MFIWHMGLLPILYALSVSLFLSLGSVHTLGAVLGCLISIPTMALLGRRGAALYVMTLAYLLGYLLIGCAQNVEMIVIGGYSTGNILIGQDPRLPPHWLCPECGDDCHW